MQLIGLILGLKCQRHRSKGRCWTPWMLAFRFPSTGSGGVREGGTAGRFHLGPEGSERGGERVPAPWATGRGQRGFRVQQKPGRPRRRRPGRRHGGGVTGGGVTGDVKATFLSAADAAGLAPGVGPGGEPGVSQLRPQVPESRSQVRGPWGRPPELRWGAQAPAQFGLVQGAGRGAGRGSGADSRTRCSSGFAISQQGTDTESNIPRRATARSELSGRFVMRGACSHPLG